MARKRSTGQQANVQIEYGGLMALDHEYILAIDLGTSGPKAALATRFGEIIDHEFAPTPYYLLPDGGAEQKPDEWWGAIKEATNRLLAKGLVPPEEITALCCTTQWSGTVAVDRSGQPLMNAIIWLDSRGAEEIDKIVGGGIAIEGYEIGKLVYWMRLTAGVPTHSGKDPIAHILYIKRHFPEVYQATYKFLEPKDYLNLRLTGKFAASFDSISLHWVTDIRQINNVTYDDRLLQMSNVEREKLPELKQAVEVLGPLTPEAAAELGLSPKVQVIMGTPDVHSAAIGSGAVRDFEGHIYVGTSSWLACHVPFKKTDLFHNMCTLPSAIPGRYMIINEQESAGVCLNYLRDNIFFHEDEMSVETKPENVYALFDRIAERTPAGSGRLIFTPWLYGERAPVDDPLVRGGFFNQTLQTTREHMVKAVFEGVAFNTRWLLGYVEKMVGRRMDSLNIVGGGARSNIWCQIYADVLDRTIRQVKDPIRANARGAAILAAVGMGYLKLEEIPEHVQIANTYQPNPDNRKIYDELFREFVNIYKSMKGIYSRLNKANLE
jgi:xylulokinase